MIYYFNYLNDIMKIYHLNNDVIQIILNIIKIECHICKLKYNFNKNFYIKKNKFYYCSKECYNFI